MHLLSVQIIIPIMIMILLIIGIWIRKRRSRTSSTRSGSYNTVLSDNGKNIGDSVRLIKRRDDSFIQAVKPPTIDKLPNYTWNESPNRILTDTLERMQLLLEDVPQLEHHKMELEQLAQDSMRPLLVVVMGQFKTGKSSFINTLLGMEATLKVDVTPSTAAVTMIVYGDKSEVIAHLTNNRTETFPLERLHSLSAEGDDEGVQFRKELRYLEVRLPNDLLKKITVVDTPGLNSDNPHHTEATEYFMNRADEVLWVFSYAQAASRFDIASLSGLQNELKPIGIVNRIDEHDPEEMELDVFLEQVRRKAGGNIRQLLAVSALWAVKARNEKDENLLKESGWEQLEQVIQTEIYGKADHKKFSQIFARMMKFMHKLQADIYVNTEKYQEAYNYVHEHESAITNLEDQLEAIQNQYHAWSSFHKESAFHEMSKHYPISIFVENFKGLNEQISLLIQVEEEMKKERKQLNDANSFLQARINQYNVTYKALEKEYGEYNQSGLFGGRPIFDLDGTGKKLAAREKELNAKANELNSQGKQNENDMNVFNVRMDRNEQEAYELAVKVSADLKKSGDRLEAKLLDSEGSKANAKELMEKQRWANIMKFKWDKLALWELGVAVASLERRLGIGDGTVSKSLDETMKLIPSLHTAFAAHTLEIATASQIQSDKTPLMRYSQDHLEKLLVLAGDDGVVTLPQGIFHIDRTLTISNSITLRGEGIDKTILSGVVETMLQLEGTGKWTICHLSFDLNQTEGCIVVADNGTVRIECCSFTGVAATLDENDSEEKEAAAVLIKGKAIATIRGCVFDSCEMGIGFDNNSEGEVESCLIWNNQVGIGSSADSKTKFIQNELVRNTIGIYVEGNSYVLIDQNRCWFNIAGIQVGEKSQGMIKQNHCIRNDNMGIHLSENSYFTLEGNLCKANHIGIFVEGHADSYAYANVCEHNWKDGIASESMGSLVLERNRCTENGNIGIANYTSPKFEAYLNNCSSNMLHGLYADDKSFSKLVQNRCYYNLDSGIWFHGYAKGSIEQNECNHNLTGIVLSGNANALLERNECINVQAGLYFKGYAQGRLIENICRKNEYGIVIMDDCQVTITKGISEENKEDGIIIGGRAEVKLERNKVCGNNNVGIMILDRASADTRDNDCSNNRVCGIVYAENSRGIAKENNCSENEAGIHVTGSASTDLQQNKCFKNKIDGIGFYNESKGIVSGNVCGQNGIVGIFLTDNSSPHVEKNKCEYNKGSGIVISGSAKGHIKQNESHTNDVWGIYAYDQTETIINNNICFKNKEGQLYFRGKES